MDRRTQPLKSQIYLFFCLNKITLTFWQNMSAVRSTPQMRFAWVGCDGYQGGWSACHRSLQSPSLLSSDCDPGLIFPVTDITTRGKLGVTGQ